MPTVTDIVTKIRPISQFLASNDIANGSLFGSRVNQLLANQLFIIGKSVLNRYDYEGIVNGATPSSELIFASNYLYSFCDKYGMLALYLINSGGIVPGTGTQTIVYGYPISGSYIAVADGETNITLSLPEGAKVVQVFKSINWLEINEYSWVQPVLYLLNGNSLSEGEKLSFLYVVPT